MVTSFCIRNRCDGSIKHFLNLASSLKTPARLAQAVLTAINKTGAPLAWKDLQKVYYDAFLNIKTDT